MTIKYLLSSLYYRCKCNGHANNCTMVPVNETVIVTAEDGTQNTQVAMVERMECICEHGTDVPSCEMFQRDHNSRPWRRATQDDANECKRESSTFILIIRDIIKASRGIV